MKRWLSLGCIIVVSSCRMIPPAPPVPVQGIDADIRLLAGQWTGRYWSQATGRHGTIRFKLPEHADTGFGEVEITFSPSLRLAREASRFDDPKQWAAEEVDPGRSTVIEITFVKVEAGQVRGTMIPYWDPECDCRTRTVFEGRRTGNRITGTFTSRRESTDRRPLIGQWQVDREPS
jgi:hypothetical protein